MATSTISRPRKTPNSPYPDPTEPFGLAKRFVRDDEGIRPNGRVGGNRPTPGRLPRNAKALQRQPPNLHPHPLPHPRRERRHDRAEDQPFDEAGDDPAEHTAITDPGEQAHVDAEEDAVVQGEDPPRSQHQSRTHPPPARPACTT